ncbi:hypothetical protein DMB38_19985 [Streptomyces sp. WAC 06738]|nr:hypothetical protein DMB38_19985 [Streptomyces sp. WAC 06738]
MVLLGAGALAVAWCLSELTTWRGLSSRTRSGAGVGAIRPRRSGGLVMVGSASADLTSASGMRRTAVARTAEMRQACQEISGILGRDTMGLSTGT